MEFLLFVQPIGAFLLPLIVAVLIVNLIGFIVIYSVAAGLEANRTYERGYEIKPLSDTVLEGRKASAKVLRALGKKFRTAALVSSLMFLPVLVAAQGWEIFKNMVIYQVATSDTADKAINNTNLLMDKLNAFIDDWDPKAKVERVEKVIETMTQEEK